jgi:hypothetical protein
MPNLRRLGALGSITSASVTSSPASEPQKINTPITNVGTILTSTDQAAIQASLPANTGTSAAGIGSFFSTLFGGATRTGAGATVTGSGVGTFTNWVPLLLAAGVIYLLMHKSKR